jgi:hypothetical protein
MGTHPHLETATDEGTVLDFADAEWSWLDTNEPNDSLAADAACLILEAASVGDLDLHHKDTNAAFAAAVRLTEGNDHQ